MRAVVVVVLTGAARSGLQRERHADRRQRGGALPRAAIAPADHRVAHDAARAHERALNKGINYIWHSIFFYYL